MTVDEQDAQAERLYRAITITMTEMGILALLAAASDAKSLVPWDRAVPKTREVFRKLATNLTAQAPKA